MTRELYRSSWQREDSPTRRTQAPRTQAPRRIRRRDLTRAQERYLLRAVALRDRLTNEALADRLGIPYNRLLIELHYLRAGK